ncbi:MAG: nucleotidyl transferase AbiEii/AbiGii toxin family protein [Spirochaetota bacterium]|nr:nucleotidyl transferase AbiEii/AbiGii toxin family protein [Spirochaetota bacterium]
MPIAKESYFTREHYEKASGFANPALAELVVHCLELVAELWKSGLSFRFKGGNSLLLILPQPERFSIDVDIVTEASRAELNQIMTEIVSPARSSVFKRFEVRPHKTKPWLPMISFNLHFNSLYQSEEDAFVMLDAVLENAPYPGVMRPLVCGDIYAADLQIETPSTSGLIGDKLLTLGPATLGIPLGKGKEAQRLKHIFDVSTLLRGEYDLALVREAIDACVKQENALQQKSCVFPDVREDTLSFLAQTQGLNDELCTQAANEERNVMGAKYATPGEYLAACRREILQGFHEFAAHLFRTKYSWQRLAEDAASITALLEKFANMNVL